MALQLAWMTTSGSLTYGKHRHLVCHKLKRGNASKPCNSKYWTTWSSLHQKFSGSGSVVSCHVLSLYKTDICHWANCSCDFFGYWDAVKMPSGKHVIRCLCWVIIRVTVLKQFWYRGLPSVLFMLSCPYSPCKSCYTWQSTENAGGLGMISAIYRGVYLQNLVQCNDPVCIFWQAHTHVGLDILRHSVRRCDPICCSAASVSFLRFPRQKHFQEKWKLYCTCCLRIESHFHVHSWQPLIISKYD